MENTATTTEQTVIKDLGQLFPCKGNVTPKGPIEVSLTPSAFVPKLSNYLFDPAQLKTMILWNMGVSSPNLFIGGPAGCGKSSIVEQFAARLGKPVFRVGCHRGLKMEDIRGQFTLKVVNGHQVTEFIPGPLVNAMKTGGILLLDEGDTLDPTTLLALNTVFDAAPYLVPETDEVIQPHPRFRVAMTGNTMGNGDASGLMKGTTRQNLAVMDRFLLVKADYMDRDDEARVLNAAVPALPVRYLEALLNLARDVRLAMRAEGDDRCEIPLSTRGVIRTGAMMAAFLKPGMDKLADETVVTCMDTAFLARASEVERRFVLSAAQRNGLTDQVAS